MAAAALVAWPPVRGTLGRGLLLLVSGQFGQFQIFLRGLGAWAPAVSILLMVAASLAVPLPVTIIMVANGLAFGVWGGMVVSLTGGLIGALTAYAIGRGFGRAVVERWLPASTLRAVDRLTQRYGPWAVVLERWLPGVPCDPVSYAAGVGRMPFWQFAGLTLTGLVPANLGTAYLGSRVPGDVPMRYWLTGIGVVVAAWVIWRVARRSRA